MPPTQIMFYKDDTGRVPALEWLQDLRHRDRRGFTRCLARIQQLAELGHELRRPEADFLRDGIYELRARQGHVNYRILYFFYGRTVTILCHALTKEDKGPDTEIDRAIRYKKAFERDPEGHSLEEALPNG
ncbi:MAG: type II toxin-antitoxin system RelE/ParE family toxin [Candidatus Tectomicrobia bacterium]|uniref:Type II toxin-antitoxin system RelE/ParE family toxin n=1 Tax=Tectimicrobiota bacterium TaxID=2528274 RepID=A0A932FWP9_UNCTE|nr:type II toxin-antitoxin system RelE/ParE family toxin [Candidatus Tectomicrobia bacterium]